MRFNPIPIPSAAIDREVKRVIDPMRDILQRAFIRGDNDERTITRRDLVRLGLATEEQISELEDN